VVAGNIVVEHCDVVLIFFSHNRKFVVARLAESALPE
jgi:hypothetical protein